MQDRIIRQVAARAIEYENGTAPEQHGLSAPRLKGAGKHAQEQIERQLDWRVAKYRKPAIDFEKGVYTKNFSQEDWLNNDDDGGAELPVNQIKAPKIDLRKTAGKI